MRPEDLLARLEAGYAYDPMYGQLCNERDQLKAENAKLRQQLADVTESMGRVEERCAKLRELVRDALTTISWCTIDCCPSDNKKRELNARARELGIEVDG